MRWSEGSQTSQTNIMFAMGWTLYHISCNGSARKRIMHEFFSGREMSCGRRPLPRPQRWYQHQRWTLLRTMLLTHRHLSRHLQVQEHLLLKRPLLPRLRHRRVCRLLSSLIFRSPDPLDSVLAALRTLTEEKGHNVCHRLLINQFCSNSFVSRFRLSPSHHVLLDDRK